MKHHSLGLRSVSKGEVQNLGRYELVSNVLKSALLHLHVMYILKLFLTHCVKVEPKRPYATDGAVAQELRKYHVTVKEDGVCPFGRRKARYFTDAHFPIGGQIQVYRLR